MNQYNNIQQLLKKESGQKDRLPVFPPTVIQAVFDGKTGANLEAILAQFNSIHVQYQGSPKDTRNIIPKEMRRPGLIITYMDMDSKTITEKANSAAQKDNDHWGLDTNWSRVDELTLSGDISVSASGTWIINGQDTRIKAVGPKGDAGLTPWLKTIDNHLHFSYDGITWEPCSEPIAAWFRWSDNKIQISRDNKTWTDLTGKFADNLFIKGYKPTISELPSGAAQGDIYGVGPTYAAEDTGHKNPIYRYYVRNAGTWVDNGSFISISAGVVQETGDSETEVMSQKAVTTKLAELGSKCIELSVSVFGNFNVDTNNHPTIKLTTEKRSVYIVHGDRQMDFKEMESAELIKEVGSLDYQMWFIVYEQGNNIYNIYKASELADIPSDALTIAAFHGKKLSYTLSNFKLNGYYVRVDNQEKSFQELSELLKTNKSETEKSLSKRLGLSVSVYGNFNIDTSNYPSVTLSTQGRPVYFAHGDRDVDFKQMESAELVKTVGSADYSLWFVVYEPDNNVYNMYNYNELSNIPSNALTIAAFHGVNLAYTLSNFTLNGGKVYTFDNEKTFQKIKDDINNVGLPNRNDYGSKVVYKLTGKGYVNTSGTILEGDNSAHCFVDVSEYKKLSVYTALNMYGYAVAFYDRNKKIIKDISIIGSDDSTVVLKYYTVDLTEDLYSNVKYAAVSCYGSYNFDKVKIELSKGKPHKSKEDLGFTKLQKPTFDINVILLYGQSLAAGQQTCPPLSVENYEGNLMIGNEWAQGSSFEPLIAKCRNYTQVQAEAASKSDQENAESPGVNLTNAIKCLLDEQMMYAVDRKFLLVNASVGGQSIELLSKSCPNNNGANYTSMLNKLRKAKDLADEENKSIGCCGVIWMQGEWNGRSYTNQGWYAQTNATSDKDSYKSLLIGGVDENSITHNGLVNDMTEDIKNIFGQKFAPIFMCSQTGIGTNKTFDMPIDMALLEASEKHDGLFMVGSSYMVPNRGVHLDSNGSRWMGEYFARLYYNVIFKGVDYQPLKPVRVTKENNSVLLEYNNENPLFFDVNTIEKINDFGFVLRQDGENITISNIELYDSSIRLITDTKLNGVVELSYAGMDVEYGNVCEVKKWKSFEKYKELPSQLKPTREPMDKDGSNLYDKNYPLNRFSVKFYQKIPLN